MELRISQRMMSEMMLRDLTKNMSSLSEINAQLSSGKRVLRPSDDPFATHKAIYYRVDMNAVGQYRKNIDGMKAWLGLSDSTLTSVVNTLQDVRELVIQGANGTLAPEDRRQLAVIVDNLRESTIQLANTKNGDKYIFSGSETITKPFDWVAGNIVYNGDSMMLEKNIGLGASMGINMCGDSAFMNIGPSSDNIFHIIHRVAEALRNNETGELQGPILSDIDSAIMNLLEAAGDVGARYNRLLQMDSVLAGLEERNRQELSNSEDIDLAEAMMQQQMKTISFQAALKVSSQILPATLLDYI